MIFICDYQYVMRYVTVRPRAPKRAKLWFALTQLVSAGIAIGTICNLRLDQANLFDSTWPEPYKCKFGWNPN